MNIDLSHKLAVITGASGELGRVMARTLAACGADVALHYHQNAAKAEELQRELTTMGVRNMIVQADITDPNAIMAMRDCIVAQLGHAHIIVNNAVVIYEHRSILDQPLEDYDGQYRSCVLQCVAMAKAFIPGMIEQKYGRVIATSTIAAMQNPENASAYVSGKRGMDGILRVLAREVGPYQITVNQIAPGWTNSERVRTTVGHGNEAYEHSLARYAERVPMKRMGTDQEVANVVAFLASDLASYVTGAFVPVAGGLIMPTI
jgi:3-oxoacyl-[acyl-carrier protein] reductase